MGESNLCSIRVSSVANVSDRRLQDGSARKNAASKAAFLHDSDLAEGATLLLVFLLDLLLLLQANFDDSRLRDAENGFAFIPAIQLTESLEALYARQNVAILNLAAGYSEALVERHVTVSKYSYSPSRGFLVFGTSEFIGQSRFPQRLICLGKCRKIQARNSFRASLADSLSAWNSFHPRRIPLSQNHLDMPCSPRSGASGHGKTLRRDAESDLRLT